MSTGKLALVALIGASMLGGCRGMISREPPIHPNWNMDHQKRIEDQEPSGFWADGRGNRAYVAGTVRSAAPDGASRPCTLPESNPHLCSGEVDGAPAAALPAELTLDAALLERGQDRFNIFCAPCHDQTGGANGTVARRGLTPVSFHSEFQRVKPVGATYKTITYGGAIMKPYAAQIPVEDRWAIAAYVKALQIARAGELDDVPASVAATNGWK
jgi:mono/diheme cytochrome c family protein